MPTFYDGSGKPYVLTQEIGRGGEGTVFYCPDDSSLVAKIYHEPIDAEKEEKLRWMAANGDERLHRVAAWIVDTLHDRAGHTVGFLMPNVRAKEIHELYSLKSRRVHFPQANWQFLLHTATNVARAFYVLHKNDHIMGDVNHGNCVVLADGTVKLIDCDSYSVKTDKMRYRCDVGVATHLAPELQGIDLSEVERETTHDNFGLAVIIFQLLFLGRHPFAGNYLGAEDKALEDCIREHRFAYGNTTVTNVKQPPGTLSLAQISPQATRMFTSAFMTRNRPEAREWIEALEDLSKNLTQCSVHIGHHYFNQLAACPWCQIEAQTGLLLFPFVSGKEFDNEFNIFTVEKLLASLEAPQSLQAKPRKLAVSPSPSPEANKIYNQNLTTFFGLAAVELFIVFFFSLAAPGCGFVFGIVLMAIFLAIRHSVEKHDKEKIEKQVIEARVDWDCLEKDWLNYERDKDFVLDIEIVRQKISDYHLLQQQKQLKAKQLTDGAFQYQLAAYLKSFELAEANLLGLTKEVLRSLNNTGLKTAADISEWRLDSFGLEDKTKDLLLRWRRKLENEFDFNPKTQLPEAAQNNFENEFTNKRQKIEKEIEKMLVTLRSASSALQHQQRQIAIKAQTLAQTLAQAESNFARVSNTALMTVVLVVIPVFVPMMVGIFQDASYRRDYDAYDNPPRLMPNHGANSRPISNSLVTYEDESNFKVKEIITDKEIAGMPTIDREKSARILHQQALTAIQAKDPKKAEKKLRLAVRYVDYYENILYTLSNLLYDQKKYAESVEFLKKSLIIDSGNENAQLLIGANYMQLKKYDEAEEIFLSVSYNKGSNSYEANFNLGLIYKKSGKMELASSYFERAVEIKPSDVEANFEYGVALYETGVKSKAMKQYEILFPLDEDKAEKLWKIINGQSPPIAVEKKVKTASGNNFVPSPTPPSYARQ